MNKHNKGVRIELLARKELEVLGWHVEQKNWNQYKGLDFWGIFDILAIKDGSVIAIQVKSNVPHKVSVRKKFNTIASHIPKDWSCHLWAKKDRVKEFDIYDLRTL